MNNTSFSEKIDFERLFFPRAVGIIGASQNPAGGGYFVRILKNKFRGPIYLFNPRLKGQKLFGIKVYGSILEIPESEPIDYVILAVPARLCPKLLEEIGRKGVPFVTIFSSGFSEVGFSDLEKNVLDIAKKYKIRILGPNCLGVYNPSSNLYINAVQSKKAGNFSAIFQSGGLSVNVSNLAVSYGCFISKLISLGNAIDLTYPDFLDYFLTDPKTAIIGLYLENLKSQKIGRRFLNSVKNLNLNRKPVILWKVGYGEATQRAIMSHTGGLAGNNKIFIAAAKQTGCSLVSSSKELAALASGFKLLNLPKTRDLGVIGIGGGSCIELVDILEKFNLKIPQLTQKTTAKLERFLPDVNTNLTNPIDLGAMGIMPNIYYRTIVSLDKDPNISAIIFVKDPERFGGFEEQVMEEHGKLDKIDLNKVFLKYMRKVRKVCKKPIICVMLKINEGFNEYKSRYRFKLSLLNRAIPVYESIELSGKVLNYLNTYREFLQNHNRFPK